MKKIRMNNYLDGFAKIYQEEVIRTNFGAKYNSKTFDKLNLIVKLAYTECNKRQQDLEFAESVSRNLSMKIKTRTYNNIRSDYKVVINNVLYDIIYLDYDRKNKEIYFYLEEIRPLEVD